MAGLTDKIKEQEGIIKLPEGYFFKKSEEPLTGNEVQELDGIILEQGAFCLVKKIGKRGFCYKIPEKRWWENK